MASYNLRDELSRYFQVLYSVNSDVAEILIAESLCSDGHLTRSLKVEDKDKEQKRESDGAKEKERCREKYLYKSIQELDLSTCERCTPSYRLLPDDVWIFTCIYMLSIRNLSRYFFDDV